MVYVDAWTRYGGSQFVDSPGTGQYHSYLCNEVVPWVDAHYRTLDAAAHRAIMGKSSGGFGAMITPMLRPDLFGALATHAGDSLYELSYIPEFGKSVRHLRDYDGDIWKWWADFQSRTSFTKEADHDLLMLLGVSACFSARDDGTVELPFDPLTGQLRPEIWQRWLDWDPVRMAPRYADQLRGLSGHLDRRGKAGRVVPRRGRDGVPRGAARDRGGRRRDPLRAVRGHPHGHRLPVPAVTGLAGRPHRRQLSGPPTRSYGRPEHR